MTTKNKVLFAGTVLSFALAGVWYGVVEIVKGILNQTPEDYQSSILLVVPVVFLGLIFSVMLVSGMLIVLSESQPGTSSG